MGYPSVIGRLHTRYSPVRHSHGSKLPIPFDLHVLGLPLAFILSQDQTLRCKLKVKIFSSSDVTLDLICVTFLVLPFSIFSMNSALRLFISYSYIARNPSCEVPSFQTAFQSLYRTDFPFCSLRFRWSQTGWQS